MNSFSEKTYLVCYHSHQIRSGFWAQIEKWKVLEDIFKIRKKLKLVKKIRHS